MSATGNEAPSQAKMTAMIRELEKEAADLLKYPRADLVSIIRNVGFICTCCAKCCTRGFNGHVFLLDNDVDTVREIDPSALMPAPNFEFCDQNGVFYVSGYALRTKKDGSCIFLNRNRCTIYDRRMSICRIYPYMLHREEGEDGSVDWRQISGLNQHGEYYGEIGQEEADAIASEVIKYEYASLSHQISFISFIRDFFSLHGLRHIQRVYDRRIGEFRNGVPVTVRVYCQGVLEERQAICTDYGIVPRQTKKAKRAVQQD